MHLEVLVEELSCEVALNSLLPRLLGPDHTWAIHVHQGKPDLLANLQSRLRGYARWLPDDWRLLIVVDRDQEDCHALKRRLDTDAENAGLVTRSRAGGGRFQVINRIVVEELEAWFFGDVAALRAAFPRVSATLDRKRDFRDPDAIRGGTAERLEQELQRAGYMMGGLEKLALARAVAPHMDPDRNRSRSFCVFRDALREMVA